MDARKVAFDVLSNTLQEHGPRGARRRFDGNMATLAPSSSMPRTGEVDAFDVTLPTRRLNRCADC